MFRYCMALLMVFSWACGASSPEPLGVEVSFDSWARSAQPSRVDVYLVDSCESVSIGQVPDDPIASTFAIRDGSTGPLVGTVSPGEYGLYALARDTSCFVVAAECVGVVVGPDTEGPLAIEVGAFTGLGCASDELCDPDTGSCVGAGDAVDCRSRADETPCASDGALGRCRAGSCCTGCWDGSTCHAGDENVRCGAAGRTCELCGCASDVCSAGVCDPQTPVAQVDVGVDHACAVADDGHLWCWGSHRSGQLGIGDAQPAGCDAYQCTVPTEMSVLLEGSVPAWTRVSAGEEVTCALRSMDGVLWCWGSNDSGRMGAPDTVASENEPVLISGNSYVAVDNEAGGGCALRADDGSLWCWGGNGAGQAGQGTSGGNVYGPLEVPYGTSWDEVTVGDEFVLAVSEERVWGWGNNSDGQLGTGETGGATHPALTGLVGSAVEAGDGTACALDASGVGHCWGHNLRGQVGNGQASGVDVTMPTPIGGGHSFDHFALSSATSCGVTIGGDLYCWGSNRYGQLGVGEGSGTLGQATEPMRVPSDSSWTSMSAGGDSACAIDENRSVWCWGRNDRGQLGLGDTQDRTSPTRLCF